jgi:hypothetical protein
MAGTRSRFIPCPVCDHVAEIQDRLRRQARGPVTYVTVACVEGHWTVVPSDELDGRTREPLGTTTGAERRMRTEPRECASSTNEQGCDEASRRPEGDGNDQRKEENP